MRFSHLRNIVVDEKKEMPRETFKRHLMNMVKQKVVDRLELGKQNVVYSIHEDVKDDDPMKSYQKLLLEITKNIKEYKKQSKKLSDVEKSEKLFLLSKFVSMLELLMIPSGNNSLVVHKILEPFTILKMQLKELSENKNMNPLVGDLLTKQIQMELFDIEKTYDKKRNKTC